MSEAERLSVDNVEEIGDYDLYSSAGDDYAGETRDEGAQELPGAGRTLEPPPGAHAAHAKNF